MPSCTSRRGTLNHAQSHSHTVYCASFCHSGIFHESSFPDFLGHCRTTRPRLCFSNTSPDRSIHRILSASVFHSSSTSTSTFRSSSRRGCTWATEDWCQLGFRWLVSWIGPLQRSADSLGWRSCRRMSCLQAKSSRKSQRHYLSSKCRNSIPSEILLSHCCSTDWPDPSNLSFRSRHRYAVSKE